MRELREINNVYRDNHNFNNNDLIIIQGCSESGKNLRILIDSGSQADLISEKTALALNKEINMSNIRLVTAQGSELKVCGQVNLNLDIVGQNYEIKPQIVKDLSPNYDLILGMTFLNNNVTCLKTQPGFTPVFCIGSQEIPIMSNTNKKGITILNISNLNPGIVDFAKIAATTVIQPRSKGFLKLAIPCNEKLLGNNLVHF